MSIKITESALNILIVSTEFALGATVKENSILWFPLKQSAVLSHVSRTRTVEITGLLFAAWRIL